MKNIQNFNEILEVLTDEELIDEIEKNDKFQKVTDENVNDFILEYGAKLIKDGTSSIDKIKNRIISAQSAEEISALSEMMRAINSTLDTLTKISLQNKKEKSAEKLRELEYQQRKELPNSPKTQIIVGTREDIFKKILEAEKEATDIEEVKE